MGHLHNHAGPTGGGSVVGNQVHDNCAGIWFEAFGPVLALRSRATRLRTTRTRARVRNSTRKFSGISGSRFRAPECMDVTANHLWAPSPQGPPYLGGVVVLDGSVLRRDGETQEQHRHRQPLWPQQAGHFLMISQAQATASSATTATRACRSVCATRRFHFIREGPASAGLFFLRNFWDLPVYPNMVLQPKLGARPSLPSTRGCHAGVERPRKNTLSQYNQTVCPRTATLHDPPDI